MEPVAATYKPSLLRLNKYVVYLDYFKEYIACKDFKSLGASLKYVFTHKLPTKAYEAKSEMGTFLIRKETNDFQFINLAYERKVKKYISYIRNQFDVFIDAGACIGEYSIWLGKLGKKCIAIEPVNFEAIQKNVALNKLEDKVQIFACGLGNKMERVHFNIPKGVTSSSYMDKESGGELNVTIETLDNLYPQFNLSPTDRILMKLDVEGMEVEALEGAAEFIKKHDKISFIYEHFKSDNYRNDKALLKLANFTFKDIDSVNRLAIKVN
ncbi:MAG: FkbM family methyltransferase [Chitinophagaceae bacterium]